MEIEFNQKKINHIFHYTNSFEILMKILRNGFAPSYCSEKINDIEYFIPMVSFCNIPLKDVDNYMRYGKYGIGMNLDWAVNNGISPVIYIHENTPFRELHSQINFIHLMNLANKMLGDKFKEITDNIENKKDYSNDETIIKDINNITVITLQFFKNWKAKYQKK